MRGGIVIMVLLAAGGCGGLRAPVVEPADARRATAAPAADARLPAATRRTDGDPVASAMNVRGATIRAGDTLAVSVVLDVAAGYEIQRLHAPPPAIATQLELKLPGGFEAVGEWSAPEAVRSQWPDGHLVYVGEATFTRQVRVGKSVAPGEYAIRCLIGYQACNDRYCLRPVALELAVGVPVQR